MKRLTWFVGGVAAGAAGTSYAKRKVTAKVRRTAEQLAPRNLAASAVGRVRGRASDVRSAVGEGRAAGRARAAELRARRDHHVEPLDARLDPDDRLMIDGHEVDSARVIVLKKRHR